MKTHNFCALISTAFLAACSVAPNSQLTINHTNDSTAVVNIENAPKYVLLPIQENKPEVQIMLNGTPMDVRLAVDSIDYTVPFPLHEGAAHDSLVVKGLPANAVAWKHMELADAFDTRNLPSAFSPHPGLRLDERCQRTGIQGRRIPSVFSIQPLRFGMGQHALGAFCFNRPRTLETP